MVTKNIVTDKATGEDGARQARRLYIKTYGCQMNVYDSERMAELLAPMGYEAADRPEDADAVILNTCHIREKAAEKVYSEIGRLKQLKAARQKDGRGMLIAVAGCVAQAEGEEIIARAPAVDLVIGPQSFHHLPALVARADAGEGGLVETGFPDEGKFSHLAKTAQAKTAQAKTAQAKTGKTQTGMARQGKVVALPRGPSAFLTVQEGCDKFCTFCVVPYTRGAEFSRGAGEIIAEASGLALSGVREITLLGQNVNAYHGAGTNGGEWGLGRLIRALAEIDGLDRIRYTTSHPRDLDDDLVSAHRDVATLMPYLHLPAQSGSDTILKAMNRRHSRNDYLSAVARIREARPDLALSSDFIVGFPGESDADFQATLDLVAEVGYAQCYSFKYSPRPGTPAADMAGQVDDAVKADRLARLQALLNGQQRAFNEGCVGMVLPVLFERAGRRPGQLVGRSPYLQAVHVDIDDEGEGGLIGAIVDVEIAAAHANSLAGRLAAPASRRPTAGHHAVAAPQAGGARF